MPDFGNGRRTVDPLSDMNSGRRDRYGEAEDKIRDSGGVSKKSYGKMMEEAGRLEARDELAEMDSKMAPPRIFEPRCSVCKHPHRDWIESILVRGSISYKGIAERVTPSLDRRSISHHYKNHMDLQDAALVAIIEEEARLDGRNLDEDLRGAITKRGALEVALRKGYEDIVNGITTVEPRDLIQIAKVLGDMDSNAYQTGLDEMRAQVQIFIQAIKDVCDRDTQAAIGQRVKELRKRENIEGQIEKVMDPGVPTHELVPAAIPEAVVVPNEAE
jgi:hypothetical protein